jgi:chaperonin cofactor prefoldin
MTTGQQTAVDQRLDQHSDAMEVVLDRLDSIDRRCSILLRQAERIKGRLHELESIVLPDPKPGGPARPTLPRI